MVFAARQLQEKCQEQNTDLYTNYVDLTKAFDTVSRDGLWRIMAKYDCPEKPITIGRQFDDGMHARVQDNSHHHHHVVLVARISLTLSHHFSLSFIASGRSSGQHPVSSHSCRMYVRAGRPAFARPCVGVHKSTSLMSLSLFLLQCPACLVRLTWMHIKRNICAIIKRVTSPL